MTRQERALLECEDLSLDPDDLHFGPGGKLTGSVLDYHTERLRREEKKGLGNGG